MSRRRIRGCRSRRDRRRTVEMGRGGRSRVGLEEVLKRVEENVERVNLLVKRAHSGMYCR